jgi:hypothetical protein
MTLHQMLSQSLKKGHQIETIGQTFLPECCYINMLKHQILNRLISTRRQRLEIIAGNEIRTDCHDHQTQENRKCTINVLKVSLFTGSRQRLTN